MDEIGPDFPFKATPKAAPPTLKIDHDCGVKITTAITSATAPRTNKRVKCPGLSVEHYLTFYKKEDQIKYRGQNKVPIETFMCKYFDGDTDFNGNVLEMLKYRHDWASFRFAWELFRFIVINFATDVLVHSRSQDKDQVQDHYDRGDDFYTWFLGLRMVYTSGIISNVTKEESLEQLQDNKLAIGNEILHRAGVSDSQIHCMDYRDMPKAKYDKITCLEMAEHVGIFKITNFLRQCRDMLEDDGVMHLQIAGIRHAWQYKDLRGHHWRSLLGHNLALVPELAGERSRRHGQIWKYFLASAAISSRQGSATCYQITLVKNINSVHRIDGVSTQFALSAALEASKKAGRAVFPANE
ncbi:cyclopropane-fatty-acyl-phospholipid synthase [Fusarium sp. NRRL 52700]|nr:cyclopropane-fatty-acyl-phospholipid synthase [Fusarium sp. NRRL 52700]